MRPDGARKLADAGTGPPGALRGVCRRGGPLELRALVHAGRSDDLSPLVNG